MFVWTLTTTRGAYLDVVVLYNAKVPTGDDLLKMIDFAQSPILSTTLQTLCDKSIVAHDGYTVVDYTEDSKSYTITLQCHDPVRHGYILKEIK